jgi:hypothetical protein
LNLFYGLSLALKLLLLYLYLYLYLYITFSQHLGCFILHHFFALLLPSQR